MDNNAKKYDMSNDAVMYTTTNLLKTYKLAKELKDQPQVETVNTITDYLPPKSIQKKRIAKLKESGIDAIIDNPPACHPVNKEKLIKQLKRLDDNIIEVGQLSYMSGIDEIVGATDEITGTPNQIWQNTSD